MSEWKNVKYNGKVIGRIKDETYRTNRNLKKHFFRKYNGFGISEKVLKVLKEREVKRIEIITEKRVYKFSINQYLQSNKTYDYQGDVQKFVSLFDVGERNKSIGDYS